MHVMAGQACEAPAFEAVMVGIRTPRSGLRRPRTRPAVVFADRAYSSRALRGHLRRRGIRAVILQPADRWPAGHRSRHNVSVELLTAVLPVGATVFVAIMGYLQWRRSEQRQAENETARQELEQAERRRIARGLHDQRRLEALQELLDKLRELEIQSRWNAGGQDLRAEVPKINTFLIQHGEVLEDEERRLAQQFLEGLTWIDHHEAEERRRWDEQREQQLSAHGSDIGSYESSWVHTGPLPPFGEVDQAVQKWTSARAALEERLRKALQGM